MAKNNSGRASPQMSSLISWGQSFQPSNAPVLCLWRMPSTVSGFRRFGRLSKDGRGTEEDEQRDQDEVHVVWSLTVQARFGRRGVKPLFCETTVRRTTVAVRPSGHLGL